MSYCRFSDMDYGSDVYCYHDCGGWWQIYVAANRLVPTEPMPPEVGADDVAGWVARHVEVMRIVGASGRENVGGEYDGASFQEASPGDAADRLEQIRAAGYVVPQWAIDELRAEQPEEPAA